MRMVNGIQLNNKELKLITDKVFEKTPCAFLVFGLGQDSIYWSKLNNRGKTVFIEDDESWYYKITRRHPEIFAYLIDYDSKLIQWEELLESQSLYNFDLPSEIKNEKWDIILVDAPEGWSESTPGRMKSIFYASRHIKPSGDIFVHDCNRKVEQIYCDRFLKNYNLKSETGLLRQYQFYK